ncbi:MAG: PilZ domain-containing protein [Ketobacteraceae bacterium]|nr:PilZ domain-containing protein [Ketobacteraceae bacterium]
MNPALDIAICLFILFIVIGSRFNRWPTGQSALFTGKPADYIDATRYRGYCLLYILTFFILTLALYSSPELLTLLPVSEEFKDAVLNNKSYTVCSVIVIAALAQQKIAAYDEQWRQQLHQWARIPRAVEEIMQSISQSDNFMLTAGYRNRIKQNLVRGEDGSLWGSPRNPYWLEVIDNLEEEKRQRSINWYYIKCVALFMIVEDICKGLSVDDLRLKENRLMELGRVIQLSDQDERETLEQKEELDKLSVHFLVNICKHLVKKYPRKDEQYTAFKNLGFMISHHDYAEVSVKDAVIWCLLVVLFVSVVSVFAILSVLDATIPGEFVTAERFLRWGSGSFVSFCVAIFVGMMMKKLPARSGPPRMYLFFLTVLISTLATFIYFQIVSDLSQRSQDLPYARVILAMSFSTLSIIVLKAMDRTSHDHRDVLVGSFLHGLYFGLVMAILQPLISLAFNWEDAKDADSVYSYFLANDWKFSMMSLIGFGKGLLVAWGISYSIQEVQRKQLLAALRQSPRVEDMMISRLKAPDGEYRINIRNLSTKGARIQCREHLALGDKIQLESPTIGRVDGVVRWTQSKLWGSQVAGIAFTHASAQLNQYIRDRYGEYYA